MTTDVKVEQIDRDAAEGRHEPFCNAFGPTPLCCSCGIEEAFARHRLAERAAIVVWLRERVVRANDQADDYRRQNLPRGEYAAGMRSAVLDEVADAIEQGRRHDD